VPKAGLVGSDPDDTVVRSLKVTARSR